MEVPPAEPSSERDALWIGVLGALALCLRAAPDVGYGDAGELGAAAVVLGVAHPTGFALDLLWLKAASLVPLGSLPFRLNVATALTGAAALGACASVIGALAERVTVRDIRARRLGVLVGVTGLFGFATFASATRAVEVYALAACAVLLALRLALAGGWAASALAVLVGLAAGLHVTAGLYVAPLFLAVACTAEKPWRFVLARTPAVLAGALVLAYLPLASRRDPAIDWGDPETLSGVLAHLTAQRIRNAFQGEMFGGNQGAPALLFDQLSAFGVLGCFMLVAAAGALIRARKRAERGPRSRALPFLIGIAIVACFDLAYALFIHPMGVRELQCGHVAGACLAILGGVSAAWLLSLKTGRFLFLPPEALVVVVSLAHLMPAVMAEPEDGHVLGELFGSGGPLSALPPRAVFLCNGDNACAAGLFASAVERARPDVDIAPAQHLWDATVLRNIEGVHAPAAATAAERAARAIENTRALIRSSARPLAFESRAIATQADPDVLLAPLGAAPFVAPVGQVTADSFTPSMAALRRALAARFGVPGASAGQPADERARFAWSRVYGELGSAALDSPAFAAGLAALQQATAIAPSRAPAWINLGVALEKTGQLEAAIHTIQAGIELDPSRATGWVNLARMELERGNSQGARKVLELAAQAGVSDSRLQALAAKLRTAGAAP
jgi:tetratricopeptide (TPR) repeat protein